jgi:anti-anti-sigma regulatory factor
MDAAAAAQAGPSLTIDKFIEGRITCLRFHGTIDESFDGRRLASTIKTGVLLLDLGGVRRISSFGIREWSDFIAGVERSADQVIAIECATRVVDQLNMVASFLGRKGQVFSFYAPYRCDYCDVDRRTLFHMDRDSAAIRSMRPPEQLCETCSRPSYFDEEPSAYLSYLAAQPAFELSPEIAEFLSSKLRYSVTGGDRRLNIDKQVDGRNTYLKFVGNLDGSFPSNKVAEGLEGNIVVDVFGVGTIDLAGAAEWRNFITQTKQGAERVFLVGCPPILLERLTRQGDLGDQVISFTMPYSCSKCATTASQVIDVEQHYDILKFATPPEMKCSHCKSPTVCVAPESLLSRLRTLPRVAIEAALRKFIKEMRERKPERARPVVKQQGSSAPVGLFTGLIAVALIGAGGLVAFNWYQQREARSDFEKAIDKVRDTQPVTSVRRPVWITSDTPLSAYCTDNVNRLSCVGISSYLKSREDARLEAVNAALDEMVVSIGLQIGDQQFAETVRPAYEDSRSKVLKQLEATGAAPLSEEHLRARETVRAARRGVAEVLSTTGGSAAPAQQAAWFWEEYDAVDGDGTEFLVFVRFDIQADAKGVLMDEYSKPAEALGGVVVTAFPGLAWRVPGLQHGALVIEAKGALADLGITELSIITELDGEPVRSAADLARRSNGKSPGELKLRVTAPDGASRDLP